jgi:hypothetical protein
MLANALFPLSLIEHNFFVTSQPWELATSTYIRLSHFENHPIGEIWLKVSRPLMLEHPSQQGEQCILWRVAL